MIVDSLGDNWRRFLFLGAALLALFLLPLPTLAKDSSIDSINLTNSSPPTPAHHFKFKQKINPVWWFENADEPAAPAWYEPGQHNRHLDWHMRNPFHNFDAYVIGVSDKPFTRSGRFPKNVFNPNGGWNWAVCHYKV